MGELKGDDHFALWHFQVAKGDSESEEPPLGYLI
jgi:hypothetical protein